MGAKRVNVLERDATRAHSHIGTTCFSFRVVIDGTMLLHQNIISKSIMPTFNIVSTRIKNKINDSNFCVRASQSNS